MLQQRNAFTFVVGLGLWLTVALAAAAAMLSFTDQVSAQDSSTSFTLSTPTLSANATANGIELSWTAVTDAVCYELWTWTSADGWQQLGGDSLTGTSYTHTDATSGITHPMPFTAIGRQAGDAIQAIESRRSMHEQGSLPQDVTKPTAVL